VVQLLHRLHYSPNANPDPSCAVPSSNGLPLNVRSQDQLFLVLEFVSGGDLSKPIKEKRRPPEAELRIWLQGVLLGLEHLHLSGIIHRDIKPENIMWDSKRQAAKLTDFGISTFFDNEHVGGDFVESTGGTFFFFAPEMTRSRQGAGYSAKAADVWAVGVSLYMWLYHKPPFEVRIIGDDSRL